MSVSDEALAVDVADERADRATPHCRIVIIGAGFGGMGMAIALRKAGIDDFVVLEREDDIGGTWRENRYPGCQCDVPSNLYSFSFAMNPDWTRSFAMQPEIEAYLHRIANEYDLRRSIRFGAEVQSARWDSARRLWHVETPIGDWTADVVVSGHGALSYPSTPSLNGLENFRGAVVHSAKWSSDVDVAGRRVAVIGVGSTGTQIVPAIQPIVEKLLVFQRTPPWVLPRPDRPVPRWKQTLYRKAPWLQKLSRLQQYLLRELMVPPFVRFPVMRRLFERVALRHMRRQVADPQLREILTPNYEIGCKRIVLSNEFYPALQQPNVELITEPIVEATEQGIRTADGREHPVETIVFATGFKVIDHPMLQRIFGRDGRSAAEHWVNGPRCYLGTTAHGFPNLFILAGPNTGIGHTSLVFMIECQIRYIIDALRWMERSNVAAIEPSAETCEAFAAEMERRLANSVWNAGGCRSWYVGESGRNSTIWPGYTFEFKRRTRRFDPERYDAVLADSCEPSATPALGR